MNVKLEELQLFCKEGLQNSNFLREFLFRSTAFPFSGQHQCKGRKTETLLFEDVEIGSCVIVLFSKIINSSSKCFFLYSIVVWPVVSLTVMSKWSAILEVISNNSKVDCLAGHLADHWPV